MQRSRLLRSLTVTLSLALFSLATATLAPASEIGAARPASRSYGLTRAGGQARPGPLSTAQKQALSQGYLVPDQSAYLRAKAAAAAAGQDLASRGGTTAPAPFTPAAFRSWEGIRNSCCGPSDSTGAVGTSRYIELVNVNFAIYNRTSNVPLATGTLNQLVGEPSGNSVFDPQIIWDPDQKRFFYAADDVVSTVENYVAFGFSKTASPSSASDWCKYRFGYGSEFPDYPKLGDSRDFALIGVNTFLSNGLYRGSDLIWISKPPTGNITTCPDPAAFQSGTQKNLKAADATPAFTPVPANQTDKSGTGWVVADASPNPASYISVFKVTRKLDGTAKVGAANTLSVASYSVPANAPQPSSTKTLDTLDGRMTQAVSAIDPARGAVAVWTQHTVLGGAGAEVRWYEINPASSPPSTFQFGVQTSATRHIFNGAISPDRKVGGGDKLFGANMVLGFNSSSSTQFADIRMVSKIGAGAVSSEVVIKASASALNDFTCQPGGPCRWGDYAAATPDPAALGTGTNGQVWLTNQWVKSAGSVSAAGWGTWNWAATP